MRKAINFLLVLALANLIVITSFAQKNTISGSVANSVTKEKVGAVSVSVKGSTAGTFTDDKGNFKITVSQLPVTLLFSSVGFELQQITVNNASDKVHVDFKPTSTLGQEVVLAATRSSIKSLESPVSIERMNRAMIVEAPSPSFYDAIANLKGVDMVTSSIMFKTPGTRGFNGSGNLRMNQLVDGMDNQAPGLNFAVGNIVGLNELDVDNVELLPGASSALYGSGGMTGTLLMTSKDPFKYQGLSVQFKQGVNHINDSNSSAAPYYDFAARYAKAFNNKFAFRISGEYIGAKDWIANDQRNFSIQSGQIVSGNKSTPNYNGVNAYGNESPLNIQQGLQIAAQHYAAAGDQTTAGELNGIAAATPSNGYAFFPTYNENTLTDYNAYDLKASAGLFYKLTNTTTASLTGNFGSANTIYQGTDRYSLKNVRIGQYKAEVTGAHYYIRAYTTQEDAGSSYDMGATAQLINANYYAPNYINAYAVAFGTALGMGATPAQAYSAATTQAKLYADANMLQPGTAAFTKALDSIKGIAIPNGGKFNDQTNLYVGEGMYNFSDLIKWADVTIGTSTREFVLNSHGTIFADTAGTISINETGAFAQIQKGFMDDMLKITVAGRYDKNSNFDGRFTPRITAVYRVAKDNFIRASYQTAYRFPSTQNQYIDLLLPSARLIGGLPSFITEYGLNTNTFDTATLGNFQRTGTPPTPYQYKQFKPETVASYELGYKGLVNKKLLIDAYGFYAQYTNFIGLTILSKDPGTPEQKNFGIYTNSSTLVNTYGVGFGLDYLLPKGFIASGNFVYNDISNVESSLQTDFNTPKTKFNLSFANYTIKKIYGFNLTYRWQQSYYFESSFIAGNTPAFGTLDAQISLKLPKISNSMIKIGATNLLNNYHTDAIGNASIGGLYYVSFAYNVF